VLTTILDTLPDSVIVATTGYTSRELAHLRSERGESGDKDFLVVGSMGHAQSVAMGMAISDSSTNVVCIDGDGSLAMHMGAMCLAGWCYPSNFIHVVLNNGAHESVGGTRTALGAADVVPLAMAAGYRRARNARIHELEDVLIGAKGTGPWLIEVNIKVGSIPNLGRPDLTGRVERFRNRAA
jgi:phosphonopyruvate decarboxylase